MMNAEQVERIALGAALLEKDGRLYEYAGFTSNGALVFYHIEDGDRIDVTEHALMSSESYHVVM